MKTLIDCLMATLNGAERTLEKFQKDFAESPAYAFEWSDGPMNAAALQKVLRTVIGALTAKDTKATPKTMLEYATEQTMKMARYPKNSTSPAMNVMARYELSAWAEITKTITEFTKEK